MELSLARLINCLVSKPDLLAEVNGSVEKALNLGDVPPTHENRAAIGAALQLLGKQAKTAGIAKVDPIIGWDGDMIAPVTATPST